VLTFDQNHPLTLDRNRHWRFEKQRFSGSVPRKISSL